MSTLTDRIWSTGTGCVFTFWLNYSVCVYFMFDFFPYVFFLMSRFVCSCNYFLHSSLLPCSGSVNSIAYRRVIRVYQYEVDDDLSGRFSFHFDSLISLPHHPPPHRLGFLLMHSSLNPPLELCVCSVFSTNPHSDVAMRQADGLFSFLILQSLAPLQRIYYTFIIGGGGLRVHAVDSGPETADRIS